MKICGGFYREYVLDSDHSAALGSGLRAAIAISEIARNVELFTYASDEEKAELETTAASYGIVHHPSRRGRPIEFEYAHGCASSTLKPDIREIAQCPPIKVQGDAVLRFGMVEGTAVVEATRCVFDPKSEVAPEEFFANGSRCTQLAIVLNTTEANVLTGKKSPAAAARQLMKTDGCAVVVVKSGIRGALVLSEGKSTWVNPYVTQKVFPLGSGDIFTAAFAFGWATKQWSACRSAQYASLATAFYCNNRFLPLPLSHQAEGHKSFKPLVPLKTSGSVYLASPFFSLGERWVVEQLRAALINSRVLVFSPLQSIGFADAERVAIADLKGLSRARVVLALLDGMDPGTVFEVGYARSLGIPVIALLTKSADKQHLAMFEGTDCQIVDDIATAIYRAGWLAIGRAG